MLSPKWGMAQARHGERMLSSDLPGRWVEESRGCRRAYSRHLGFACEIEHQRGPERQVGAHTGAKKSQDKEKRKMSG